MRGGGVYNVNPRIRRSMRNPHANSPQSHCAQIFMRVVLRLLLQTSNSSAPDLPALCQLIGAFQKKKEEKKKSLETMEKLTPPF